jgi:NAD(P)-dependent dehydrogenase (short-subunit alcohol dehydrogenase family)
MMSLENRVAVITGGGRAVGKTIAFRLAREGADVVLAGPGREDLEAAAAEVQALGRRALAVVTDVAREDQVQALAERARQAFGRIDVLVNNAGIIGPTSPAIHIHRTDWDEVLAVNLTGAFLCCKAVLPDMLARRSGKVINIASVAGKIAYALRSPYAVSKWGLIGLTLTLAKEVGPYNIQVNAICPGPVRTPMSEEEGDASVDITPLRRRAEPDEISSAVAFLASDDAVYITGAELAVDGGYLAR